MPFHQTISDTEQRGNDEVKGIKSAVAEHDAGALRKMLSDVNHQNPREEAERKQSTVDYLKRHEWPSNL